MLYEPLRYLDFKADHRIEVRLDGFRWDTGETTVLGVPCLTIRENTERPVTLTQGTNTLVG
jgi:UDP-N-acetylglucosamine 2-epimerase (non-hydrolysing)